MNLIAETTTARRQKQRRSQRRIVPAQEPKTAKRRLCLPTQGTFLFLLTCVILASMWFGPFLAAVNREGIFDWAKESYIYRYLHFFVRSEGCLPLSFFGVPAELHQYPALNMSSSYWANPEVPTLSFFPLLALGLPPGSALKAYFAVHVIIGILGIWFLARQLRLMPAMACLLFILTILNPYHMQHWAIAYTPYVTLFFVPWIAGLLVYRRGGVLTVYGVSFLLALMLYEGGLHPFMLVLAGMAVLSPLAACRTGSFRIVWRTGGALILALLLLLPKLVAVRAHFSTHRLPSRSYQSFFDLWHIFTDAQSPLYDLPAAYSRHNVNWYDGSFYMGLGWVALVLGALCSFFFRLRSSHEPWRQRLTGIELLVAAALFVVLGWGEIWWRLALQVPALAAEVYPWRFLVVSVALLCVFCVRELDWLWRNVKRAPVRLALGMGVLLVSALISTDLYRRNAQFSRVAVSEPVRFPELSWERVGTFSPAIRILPNGQGEPLQVSFQHRTYQVHLPAGVPACPFVIPWARSTFEQDFTLKGAAMVGNTPHHGPVLQPDGDVRTITLVPKSDGSRGLAGLVIFAFLLISAGVYAACGGAKSKTGRKADGVA